MEPKRFSANLGCFLFATKLENLTDKRENFMILVENQLTFFLLIDKLLSDPDENLTKSFRSKLSRTNFN